MDIVDGLRAFVSTAQTGSFTAAAEQLGISNRLTSKYVGELEARLGIRLFQRTTRKVGLTPAGETLLARAPVLLESLDDLLSDLSEESRGYSGTLRISAPVTFGEFYVAGMLGRFAQDHPDLTIDLRLSDRYVDMAAEGIDLAFRIGVSDTLSLKSRKLAEIGTYAVASPDYVARFGRPKTPADLVEHAIILDSNRRQSRRWSFWRDGVEEAVNLKGQFIVNSARASGELAVAGNGIAYTPAFSVRDQLDSGRLVTLLEEYTSATTQVSAVYLEGRALPKKTRALIEFAVEDIRSHMLL
jgi:DNA-binding transcriptional LysR family regulator